jgi:hypothetical protein
VHGDFVGRILALTAVRSLAFASIVNDLGADGLLRTWIVMAFSSAATVTAASPEAVIRVVASGAAIATGSGVAGVSAAGRDACGGPGVETGINTAYGTPGVWVGIGVGVGDGVGMAGSRVAPSTAYAVRTAARSTVGFKLRGPYVTTSESGPAVTPSARASSRARAAAMENAAILPSMPRAFATPSYAIPIADISSRSLAISKCPTGATNHDSSRPNASIPEVGGNNVALVGRAAGEYPA